jgi:hypothetical protein
LGRLHQLYHLGSQAGAGKSPPRLNLDNLNNTTLSHHLALHYLTKSRDNSYCGWLYSLMFVGELMVLVAHHAHWLITRPTTVRFPSMFSSAAPRLLAIPPPHTFNPYCQIFPNPKPQQPVNVMDIAGSSSLHVGAICGARSRRNGDER